MFFKAGPESDDEGEVLEPEADVESEEEDEAAVAARMAKAVAKRKGGDAAVASSTPSISETSSSSAASRGSMKRSVSSNQGGSVAGGNQSLCSQMMSGMDELLGMLEVGNPHYVRCIKTNEEKKKANVDLELVEEQVRYLGIRENVLVRRVGFCFYQPYEEFVSRYRIISRLTWPPKPSQENNPPSETDSQSSSALTTSSKAASSSYGSGKKGWMKWACVGILSNGEPSEWVSNFGKVPPILLTEGVDYRLGKDKVFIRQPASLQLLEDARQMTLGHVACIIQSFFRKLVYWKRYMCKYLNKGNVVCEMN
jgi:myosin heavy subunit